jgi:hypothetical protein
MIGCVTIMLARQPPLSSGVRCHMSGLAVEARKAPAIFHFNSVAEWLASWVAFQLAKPCPSATVPSGDALYLCGSIGFDSAIAPDGTVWLNDYGHTDQDNWRVATSNERMSILVSAQQGNYPELIALLPVRPVHANLCTSCGGSGFMHPGLRVWCPSCGSLGWVVGSGT